MRDLRSALTPAILALVVAVGAAGCDSADDRPAEWSYLSPAIFQTNCASTSCHGPAAAVSGLDFSTADRGVARASTALWSWVVVAPDAGRAARRALRARRC